MNLIDELKDFLFPKTCVISGELIKEDNSNSYINDESLNMLERLSQKDLQELSEKTDSDYAISLFSFRESDDFSKIIYELKYAGKKNLGTFLGRLLGYELLIHLHNKGIPGKEILVPIPLYKSKKRDRGYNQSDYLCKGISEILEVNFKPDLLLRVKNTNTQTKLNRLQRAENVKDAFKLNVKYAKDIKNKNIILIDDVITTGSTVNEAIKLLRLKGAGEITVCSAAMARD